MNAIHCARDQSLFGAEAPSPTTTQGRGCVRQRAPTEATSGAGTVRCRSARGGRADERQVPDHIADAALGLDDDGRCHVISQVSCPRKRTVPNTKSMQDVILAERSESWDHEHRTYGAILSL